MAELLAFEKKKWLVARGTTAAPQFLRSLGAGFGWTSDPLSATHFDDEHSAGSMAGRVAGGAVIAEVVIA